MKTITLKFVVPDEKLEDLATDIGSVLENESFPLYEWLETDSTEKEITWQKKTKEI